MTSTDSLHLTPTVRTALLDHAREGAPREVCGLLAGARGPPDRVTETRRVANVDAHPRTRYELDSEATVAAIDAAEAAGRDVVGFYHSHPDTDPVPSETDRDRATWPGYVYVIVAPPEAVRAYRYTGDGFDALPVQVSESRE